MLIFVCVLWPVGAAGAAAPMGAPTLSVYAAADLAFAFAEMVPRFEREAGVRVTVVLGSSGLLARQIEHGAAADVFFSADRELIEDLRRKEMVRVDTETLYAEGRLALVAPRAAGRRLRDLRDLVGPDIRRVAMANPDHAPYGRAAREALEALGLWERLRTRLVYADNIRHALQYVQSGAVDAGIVALALADAPEVTAVRVDPQLHRPVLQFAVVLRRSPRPDLGLRLLRFVTGAEGRSIMKRYGFVLPGDR